MKKTVKVTLCCLFSCVSLALVSAQVPLPLPFPPAAATGLTEFDLHKPVSNTDNSTAGRFDNDIGRFLSITSWKNLDLDRGFVFAGIQSLSLAVPFIEFGGAGMLNTVYIAGYYSGNVVYTPSFPEDRNNTTYPESSILPDGTYADRESYSLGKTWQNQKYLSNNTFAVLMGLGNVGIKLHFSQAGETGKPDGMYYEETYLKSVGTKKIQDSSKSFTHDMHYLPHLALGTYFSAGEFIIKPKMEMQVGILDKQVYREINYFYSVNGVETYSNEDVLRKTNTGGSVIQPAVKLAASVDFPQKNFAAHSVGLEYVFKGDFYSNNRYTLDGASKSVAGTVTNAVYSVNKDTLTDSTLTQTTWQQTLVNVIHNGIKPNYEVALEFGERFCVGLDAAVAFGFSNENQTRADREYIEAKMVSPLGTATLTQKPLLAKYAVDTFSFIPEISAGAQFAALPGKVFINAGITVTPGKFTLTSTAYKGKTNGSYTETLFDGSTNTTILAESNPQGANYDKAPVKKTKWEQLPVVPYINIGLSWYITQQVLLDMNYKINTGALAPPLSSGNTLMSFLSDPITLQLVYKY